jgi:exodeoxyribonuclease VII large subunit
MAPPFPPTGTTVLTVTQLTREIKGAIQREFPTSWISGEISNLKKHSASGHYYFSLKDDTSVMPAVMYRGSALRLRFEPRDGMEVIAKGILDVYEPQGKYQLCVEAMQPQGIGGMELARKQLEEKLRAKGYFDPRRKKPLPTYPRTIALVTSPNGAAVRDLLELLTHRWPIAKVIVVPVRVQGEGSALEIATAIGLLNQIRAMGHLFFDAMIVGRGGGSLEDLWSFNEEIVAESIYRSLIPVVSAVGHETDVTIADLVADHRALTPSHAVTSLTPDLAELHDSLNDLSLRMSSLMRRKIERSQERLQNLANRKDFRRPLDRLRDLSQKLDGYEDRLERAEKVRLSRGRERIASLAAQLHSLSPLNILARGYSLTQRAQGELLRNAGSVAVGDRIVTRLDAGEIVSRVEEVRPIAEVSHES